MIETILGTIFLLAGFKWLFFPWFSSWLAEVKKTLDEIEEISKGEK